MPEERSRLKAKLDAEWRCNNIVCAWSSKPKMPAEIVHLKSPDGKPHTTPIAKDNLITNFSQIFWAPLPVMICTFLSLILFIEFGPNRRSLKLNFLVLLFLTRLLEGWGATKHLTKTACWENSWQHWTMTLWCHSLNCFEGKYLILTVEGKRHGLNIWCV